jgi:hypothetical protein
MATFAQIQDQEAGPLNDLEREIVRQILNITGVAGSATYLDSNARMTLLTGSQCRVVRALILDYDDIGFDTTKAQGLGRDYDPERDKDRIAGELRRMLYPTDANNNPEDGSSGSYQPAGTIQMIPVTYGVGSNELS